MISTIVFSKNRPLQLSEYLRTLEKYSNTIDAFCYPWATVLYKADDLYKLAYHELITRYGQRVKFVEETNFADQLLDAVFSAEDFVLFGTDDTLFYRRADLEIAQRILDDNPIIKAFSLRLGDNVRMCHPAYGAESRQPELFKVDNIRVFRWDSGTVDWNYPYEVSASLYRKTDIIHLLQAIKNKMGPKALSHPNLLESAMHQCYLNGWVAQDIWGACFDKPPASVITVNRSQDLFPNRIYQEVSLETMLNHFAAGRQYDCEAYALREYNSIHIGDFILKDVSSCER